MGSGNEATIIVQNVDELHGGLAPRWDSSFDVVITDINMAVMDVGEEGCDAHVSAVPDGKARRDGGGGRRGGATRRRVTIIGSAALMMATSVSAAERCRACGVSEVFAKPIRTSTIEAGEGPAVAN